MQTETYSANTTATCNCVSNVLHKPLYRSNYSCVDFRSLIFIELQQTIFLRLRVENKTVVLQTNLYKAIKNVVYHIFSGSVITLHFTALFGLSSLMHLHLNCWHFFSCRCRIVIIILLFYQFNIL